MAEKKLEDLLYEYAQKRRKAEQDLDNRKKQLYEKYPRLEEIEDAINRLSIEKAKSILNGNAEINEFDTKIDNLKKEKDVFLEKNKINKKDLEIKYECDNCKDRGYITDSTGRSVMCNCLKQKMLDISYNKSNLSDIKKENFENFNIDIFSDEVNTQKYKIKCSPRENMENIKKAGLKFIDNFDNIEEKNLLFIGNTGLGKTYMTNCIANEILKKGKTVLYQTAPVLFETIISNKFNKTRDSDEFYKNILNVDLLIIDDLGTENPNSMTIGELFTIINTRILKLNNKPTKTIISTNLSIEKIFKFYEERIGSRIAGYYNIYQFFGEDLRLKNNI